MSVSLVIHLLRHRNVVLKNNMNLLQSILIKHNKIYGVVTNVDVSEFLNFHNQYYKRILSKVNCVVDYAGCFVHM
jgi:hypothetical protein